MGIFDDSPGILLIGSETKEIFKGSEEIRQHLKNFFNNSMTIFWDLAHVDIDQKDLTACVFVNGLAIITAENGTISKLPYRYSVVMVKVGSSWKWRMFYGSVPEK